MVTRNQQKVLRYFMVSVNAKYLKTSMCIFSTSECRLVTYQMFKSYTGQVATMLDSTITVSQTKNPLFLITP